MTEDHLFCHTAPQENPEAKGHITVNPAASGPFSFQSHFRASPPKSPPNSTRFLPQSLPQGFGLLPQPFWRAKKDSVTNGVLQQLEISSDPHRLMQCTFCTSRKNPCDISFRFLFRCYQDPHRSGHISCPWSVVRMRQHR